ncbi:MAG: hypothetical protein KDB80_18070 [Planctomycetes bacterium]|nr:hypothetical protein [Planctomycetota bacterium]
MSDHERIRDLQERLDALAIHVPRPRERAIHEVACAALAHQISELGRRLQRRNYWRSSSAALTD